MKETTNDIDRLLGTLNSAPQGPTASGLRDVPSLVERVRAVGVPIAFTIEGEPGRLLPEVDHTAYRVIQEGLTNVMKHGRDAVVTINVRHGPESAVLEVISDGATEPDPGASPPPTANRGGR